MAETPHTPSSFYHELNLDYLRLHAQRWANLFSYVYIDRIVLYNYSSLKYQKYFKNSSKAIYAIVFETSEIYTDNYLSPNEKLMEHLKIVDGERYSTPFHRFLAETEYLQTIKSTPRFLAFVGADFRKVYKDSQTSENYLDEWTFIPLALDDRPPLQVMQDEPHIVLYEQQPPTKLYGGDIEKAIPVDQIKGEEESKKKSLAHEKFVKSLEFAYENDSTITIREPRKEAQQYTSNDIYFRNDKTKEWKALIKILENHPHIYSLGRSRARKSNEAKIEKSYNNKRNILKEINSKLLKMLTRDFSLSFPRSYKIYEPSPDNNKGNYRFKFTIKSSMNLTKEKVEKNLQELTDKYYRIREDGSLTEHQKDEIKERIEDNIKDLAIYGQEKGFLTKEELFEYCKPLEEDPSLNQWDNQNDSFTNE